MCWEIGVDLAEEFIRLSVDPPASTGDVQMEAINNCTEMELCKSSLMNSSDHLYFQKHHKSMVVSEGLMVLAWHQLKLQMQFHFFILGVQIHLILKWKMGSWGECELQCKKRRFVSDQMLQSCAVSSWLHLVVIGCRRARYQLNPGSWAESD